MPRDERDPREDALFEKLYDALDEQADAETIRESLTSAGIDVDTAVREGQKVFASFLAQQRLVRARERLERIRSVAISVRGKAIASLDAAREELARILAGEGTGEKYLAYHRQLRKIDEHDLASLTDDAALIDFVEQFESQEPHA
jgi:hypothetical protein